MFASIFQGYKAGLAGGGSGFDWFSNSPLVHYFLFEQVSLVIGQEHGTTLFCDLFLGGDSRHSFSDCFFFFFKNKVVTLLSLEGVMQSFLITMEVTIARMFCVYDSDRGASQTGSENRLESW